MLRKWIICLIQEYDISLSGYEYRINITTVDAITIKRRLKLCFICKFHLLSSRQNVRKRVIYFKAIPLWNNYRIHDEHFKFP